MKIRISAIIAVFTFLPLTAGPEDGGATAQVAGDAADAIKKRLLESLKADLKGLDESDERQRYAINLLIQGVVAFDPDTAAGVAAISD